MLVEYSKIFFNKDDRYPKSFIDMTYVTREQPEHKQKCKTPPKIKEKDKEEREASFSQKG